MKPPKPPRHCKCCRNPMKDSGPYKICDDCYEVINPQGERSPVDVLVNILRGNAANARRIRKDKREGLNGQ